jgi:hypothetical protein
LLVAEDDAFDHAATFTVEPRSDGPGKPSSQSIGYAGEPAASSDEHPSVGTEDDVDPLVPEPRALVEAVLRWARQANRRDGFEQAALRRGAAERELEECGLPQSQTSEAAHLRRYTELKAARACRARDHEERTLGRIDVAEKDAAIEGVETSAAPPPTQQSQNAQQEYRA